MVWMWSVFKLLCLNTLVVSWQSYLRRLSKCVKWLPDGRPWVIIARVAYSPGLLCFMIWWAVTSCAIIFSYHGWCAMPFSPRWDYVPVKPRAKYKPALIYSSLSHGCGISWQKQLKDLCGLEFMGTRPIAVEKAWQQGQGAAGHIAFSVGENSAW